MPSLLFLSLSCYSDFFSPNFPKSTLRLFFRDQIFQNQIPSEIGNWQKSRNQNVTLWLP